MRLLIVEDEPALQRQLADATATAGYVVDRASDGAAADFLMRTEAYDAVILDLGLPRVDGLTLVAEWRNAGIHVPVLVLTARSSWHEKVHGIDEGADDYVTKPFQIEEVLARLRGLIRRASRQPQPLLRSGAITLDARLARVTRDGVTVKLTSHEFRVLSYLMHQAGRVVSQTELTDHIYAHDADRDSNTVEVFVARLQSRPSEVASPQLSWDYGLIQAGIIGTPWTTLGRADLGAKKHVVTKCMPHFIATSETGLRI